MSPFPIETTAWALSLDMPGWQIASGPFTDNGIEYFGVAIWDGADQHRVNAMPRANFTSDAKAITELTEFHKMWLAEFPNG